MRACEIKGAGVGSGVSGLCVWEDGDGLVGEMEVRGGGGMFYDAKDEY